MPKKILIAVDDFGIHTSVNQAVYKLTESRRIDTCSFIVSGNAYQEAIGMAKSLKGPVEWGCHLTLVEENPVLPNADVPSLIDKSTGRFHSNFKALLWQFLFGKVKPAQIEAEWTAQIEGLLKEGLQIGHLNSHQHIHTFPGLIEITVNLAKRYGIQTIRIPLEPWGMLRRNIGVRGILIAAMNLFSARAERKIREAGLRPRFGFGVTYSGGIGRENVLAYSRRIPTRLRNEECELIMHPHLNNQVFNEDYRHWGFDGEKEFRTLMEEDLRTVLETDAR